jgi:hypothetical protein
MIPDPTITTTVLSTRPVGGVAALADAIKTKIDHCGKLLGDSYGYGEMLLDVSAFVTEELNRLSYVPYGKRTS